jgi:hypothetical protein
VVVVQRYFYDTNPEIGILKQWSL